MTTAFFRSTRGIRPFPSWHEVSGEIWAAKDFSVENELYLRDVVLFQGRMCFEEGCELPHSKSPEDMTKSLARQILDRWANPPQAASA